MDINGIAFDNGWNADNCDGKSEARKELVTNSQNNWPRWIETSLGNERSSARKTTWLKQLGVLGSRELDLSDALFLESWRMVEWNAASHKYAFMLDCCSLDGFYLLLGPSRTALALDGSAKHVHIYLRCRTRYTAYPMAVFLHIWCAFCAQYLVAIYDVLKHGAHSTDAVRMILTVLFMMPFSSRTYVGFYCSYDSQCHSFIDKTIVIHNSRLIVFFFQSK